MKAPLSWIRELAALPDDVTADDLDDGWWLTVAAQGFPDAAAVQQWCAGAGLAPPACTPRQLTDRIQS